MTNERRVLVHPDKEALVASVAARFLTKIIDVLEEQNYASVVVSGGSVSTVVLAAINASPARDSVDWSKVSFWWADERWVEGGHADRNDLLWWYEQTGGHIGKAFLVHGEPAQMEALQPGLQEFVTSDVVMPEPLSTYDI